MVYTIDEGMLLVLRADWWPLRDAAAEMGRGEKELAEAALACANGDVRAAKNILMTEGFSSSGLRAMAALSLVIPREAYK